MAKKKVLANSSKALEKAADEFLAKLARSTGATTNSWEKPTWSKRKLQMHWELHMDTEQTKSTLALLADGEVFRTALNNFVQHELLGPEGVMYQLYHSKMTKEYLPETLNSGMQRSSLELEVAEKLNAQTGKRRRVFDPGAEALARADAERKTMGLYRGFADLWQALSVFRVDVNEGVVTAGIGPRSTVENLRLSDYMRMQGSTTTTSPFNNLFYAVEYGTGIYADHNGQVRLDGPTKDSAHDGSWWLGREAGQGLHFAGERGFHFLFEQRSRRPQEYIMDQVREKFPQYIIAALKAARETQ